MHTVAIAGFLQLNNFFFSLGSILKTLVLSIALLWPLSHPSTKTENVKEWNTYLYLEIFMFFNILLSSVYLFCILHIRCSVHGLSAVVQCRGLVNDKQLTNSVFTLKICNVPRTTRFWLLSHFQCLSFEFCSKFHCTPNCNTNTFSRWENTKSPLNFLGQKIKLHRGNVIFWKQNVR